MADVAANGTDFDAGLRIFTALSEFNRHWEGMNVTVAMLFVKIAQADFASRPLSITEASEATSMTLASASRNIQLLEQRRATKDSDPLDLVVIKAHPKDYRTKVVTLTPKGRNMYKRILELMR